MILAADIATNTGFCWGDGTVDPVLESHRLPATGDDLGAFLCAFEDHIRSVIGRVQPSLLVFEAPILPRPKFNKVSKKMEGGTSLITTRKLEGLVGMTEVVCTRLGLPCGEAHGADVKQVLTGKGNAKKHQMVAACRSLGLNPKVYIKDGEETSDEADAFGVWLCGLRDQSPALFEHWDRRLRVARGLLV